MKRLILAGMLLFLFVIFLPVASFSEDKSSLTILATGSVKGVIEPCAV
jgi:hypothetical protein